MIIVVAFYERKWRYFCIILILEYLKNCITYVCRICRLSFILKKCLILFAILLVNRISIFLLIISHMYPQYVDFSMNVDFSINTILVCREIVTRINLLSAYYVHSAHVPGSNRKVFFGKNLLPTVPVICARDLKVKRLRGRAFFSNVYGRVYWLNPQWCRSKVRFPYFIMRLPILQWFAFVDVSRSYNGVNLRHGGTIIE